MANPITPYVSNKIMTLEQENHALKCEFDKLKELFAAATKSRESMTKKRDREEEQIYIPKTDIFVGYNNLRDNCFSRLQNLLQLQPPTFLFNEMR